MPRALARALLSWPGVVTFWLQPPKRLPEKDERGGLKAGVAWAAGGWSVGEGAKPDATTCTRGEAQNTERRSLRGDREAVAAWRDSEGSFQGQVQGREPPEVLDVSPSTGSESRQRRGTGAPRAPAVVQMCGELIPSSPVGLYNL